MTPLDWRTLQRQLRTPTAWLSQTLGPWRPSKTERVPRMTSELKASQTPSLNQVLRALKRKENCLYNCVHSVAADTAFVREIADLYKGLPICANLRCGLWYTPAPDLKCYFKSTDGHYGNWSFSKTRLNLNVALAAARSGGCLIVDSTRRGKSFPVRMPALHSIRTGVSPVAPVSSRILQDAFTKTIPIWAAVLNEAVNRHRTRKLASPLQELGRKDHPSWEKSGAQDDSLPDLGTTDEREKKSNSPDWGVEVHLPLWISRNERVGIQQRVESWVSDLLQVCQSTVCCQALKDRALVLQNGTVKGRLHDNEKAVYLPADCWNSR